jgi:L-rhamnose isomerase/sugar isomerase
MTTFEAIRSELEALAIEVPSWAYGNSGTRFKVFGTPGTPRTVQEKIADAAQVHRFTGLAPTVALHIPWDMTDDFTALRTYAEDLGVSSDSQQQHLPGRRLQAGQPHQLRPEDPAEGSRAQPRLPGDHATDRLTRPQDLACRRHQLPGQGDMRARQDWLAEGLATIYEQLSEHQRLVLEYKFFEPAFYHTDVPDWGTSYVHVSALGPKAMVCLDTGHHAPGTNIEFIVAQLLRLDGSGPFDFNSRFYADDDLIVGSADPFQLFRIVVEVVRGGGYGAGSDVALMLDQCHNIEKKIPARSVSAQRPGDGGPRAPAGPGGTRRPRAPTGDVLRAHEIFMDAFYTDVRPRPRRGREARELPADPMRAYSASGYQKRIEADRVGGAQAGWN